MQAEVTPNSSTSSSRRAQSAGSIDEEIEIAISDVQYLLILNNEVNFLLDIKVEGDAPTLVLVYTTAAGQEVTKSALRKFRTDALERDDVSQPSFYRNFVFYGGKKADISLEPNAQDELAVWNVETLTFVASNPAAEVAPEPYVVLRGKTWQPWRIYYDFNACFMTSFKPSPEAPGR
ncbi:uncharacterized protein BDZ99DRAFT_519839 [Mytilinidion resinicola]|uniref:Uncharacterized protein n=1 Tax=Mytilinidion resinicola TaxID=574789 RepID=A0A6A6YRJ6_9PEZI|nr:uncharacterized protein BDZ99DRAFT_519839 [Mytilinidion resinicola]KAF2811178.1 hypothetical protein BDZ99DRAFT_519839 [Mytilinidion resinicola]